MFRTLRHSGEVGFVRKCLEAKDKYGRGSKCFRLYAIDLQPELLQIMGRRYAADRLTADKGS